MTSSVAMNKVPEPEGPSELSSPSVITKSIPLPDSLEAVHKESIDKSPPSKSLMICALIVKIQNIMSIPIKSFIKDHFIIFGRHKLEKAYLA